MDFSRNYNEPAPDFVRRLYQLKDPDISVKRGRGVVEKKEGKLNGNNFVKCSVERLTLRLDVAEGNEQSPLYAGSHKRTFCGLFF